MRINRNDATFEKRANVPFRRPAEAGGAIAGDEIDVACLHWTTKK